MDERGSWIPWGMWMRAWNRQGYISMDIPVIRGRVAEQEGHYIALVPKRVEPSRGDLLAVIVARREARAKVVA